MGGVSAGEGSPGDDCAGGCGSRYARRVSSRRWVLVASNRALPRPHRRWACCATRSCYKVFLVYISNVYDNLPTEEVARSGGRGLPRREPGPPAAGRRGADRHGDQCRAGRTPRADREAATPRPAAADGSAGGAAHRVPDTPKGRLLDGAAPSMCAGAPAQAGGMSTESITNTVAFAVGMLPQSTMFPLTSGASGVPVISTMSPCALITEPAVTRPWAS